MKTCERLTLKEFKGACRKPRKHTKAYSDYIYKIKKASPAVSDSTAVPTCLQAETFAQVATEAARLAQFNRRGTITQREVYAAVRALRPKKNAEKDGT